MLSLYSADGDTNEPVPYTCRFMRAAQTLRKNLSTTMAACGQDPREELSSTYMLLDRSLSGDTLQSVTRNTHIEGILSSSLSRIRTTVATCGQGAERGAGLPCSEAVRRAAVLCNSGTAPMRIDEILPSSPGRMMAKSNV
jgi:hypothetical protein